MLVLFLIKLSFAFSRITIKLGSDNYVLSFILSDTATEVLMRNFLTQVYNKPDNILKNFLMKKTVFQMRQVSSFRLTRRLL